MFSFALGGCAAVSAERNVAHHPVPPTTHPGRNSMQRPGMRHCALGKQAEQALSQLDIFRREFMNPHSCAASYLEKH